MKAHKHALTIALMATIGPAIAGNAMAQVTTTPPPAPSQPQPSTGAAEPQLIVTSSPSNSIVGDYKIDFAALDTNGDDNLSRSEAKANATLSAEFRAVDINGNGKLSKDELKGWM